MESWHIKFASYGFEFRLLARCHALGISFPGTEFSLGCGWGELPTDPVDEASIWKGLRLLWHRDLQAPTWLLSPGPIAIVLPVQWFYYLKKP